MPSVQYVAVSSEEAGQKLTAFLQRRLEDSIPRSALMRWVRTGQVRVDNARCKPFVRLKQGQTVRIPPYQHNDRSECLQSLQEKNPFTLRKVYEDDRLLVLAKPPNLAVQPGSNLSDSVVHRIRRMYTKSSWLPTLVHRLDKQTSGLLLLAKSYEYLQTLQQLWKQGRVDKIYLTWVGKNTHWSSWKKLQDHIARPEGRQGQQSGKRQQAISYVRTLGNTDQGSLLAVRLVTGRKHQIRVQLAKRGIPVLGDNQYQGPRSSQGLMLHAGVLSWPDYSFHLDPPWLGEFQVRNLQHWELTKDSPFGESEK